MIRTISIAMLAMAFGTTAFAVGPARTFAQRVAEARQGIIEDADQTFLDLWKEPTAPDDLTATQVRGISRWMAVGAYFAACNAQLSPTLKADWFAAVDKFSAGPDAGGAAGYRAGLRERGLRLLERGDDGAMAELTQAERKQICAINLEAARQIVAEISF